MYSHLLRQVAKSLSSCSTKERTMLKKTLAASVIALFISSPALAIDVPEDASPGFYSPATAYSSKTFNSILEGLGLKLDASMGDKLPSSYGLVQDGAASLNSKAVAYSPKQYHDILTAYGLQLTTEDAKNKLMTSSYASVAGDEISFGTGAIAYGAPEWINILSAYSMPMEEKMAMTAGDDDGDGVANDKDSCPNTPMGARVDERGCWAYGADVYFAFDSAAINNNFQPMLDKVAEIFEAQPDLKVNVDGHTDSVGTEEYNQGLSERRAKAVVQSLVDRGVAADRLNPVGHGELKPAYPNDTPENRAKNRRVELTPMQ